MKVCNGIKNFDAIELNRYLATLNDVEHAWFIRDIAVLCDVNKSVVYGWKYMTTRIPKYAKSIIENYANIRIFSSNYPNFHEKKETTD